MPTKKKGAGKAPRSPLRDPSVTPGKGPKAPLSSPAKPPAPPVPALGGPGTASLLRLEKPFDVDEFCQQLGETRISATVPREHLTEVLKRVVEFMEFGIYVYAVVVLPGPSPTLEKFTVTLDRIDFDPQRKGWIPFQEKGRSDSPFGPGGKGPTRSAPHA